MIRQLRKLTQEQLAIKINKTRSAVSFIELSGNVNAYTLESIAKALNISKEELSGFDHKAILLKEPGSKSEAVKVELESIRIKYEAALKQIDDQKEIIKSLKKVISVLETKKRR